MSVTGLSSDPNKIFKISKNSGELDVFEAAGYFSGAIEHQRVTGRMSLDMPMTKHSSPPQIHLATVHQNKTKENRKKYKQPSSPGGRLASFLNSLFNQTSSKKKKSKSKDVEEEGHGGRRKRSSSISHFSITTTNASADDSKSLNSSSASGLRTPPPYGNTPLKSYKEFRSFSDQKRVVSLLPNNYIDGKYIKPCSQNDQKRTEHGSSGEKFRIQNVVSEKISVGFEERESRKFSDFDDGGDSDSSSDLFDLPNHDLDFYPTGLPLYETTHMDRIKIGAPITSCSH